MAQASATETVNAPLAHFFKVINEFENYGKFMKFIKSVTGERLGPGHSKVVYHLDLFADVKYTVNQYDDLKAGRLHWELIESNVFKKNTGSWTLREVSPGVTEARYDLEVEFKIYVPGFVLKKLVQGSLPEMMRSFVEYAERTK